MQLSDDFRMLHSLLLSKEKNGERYLNNLFSSCIVECVLIVIIRETFFHIAATKIPFDWKDLIFLKHALARNLKSSCYKFVQPQKSAVLGLLFGLLWVILALPSAEERHSLGKGDTSWSDGRTVSFLARYGLVDPV